MVLDTSMIIDYIDDKGSFHNNAYTIFEQLKNGIILGILSHPTLAETYYVSIRLYEKMRIKKPFEHSEKLVKWLYSHPSIELADNTYEMLKEVAKAKIELKLSLSDCYVLATARVYDAKAIFKKREIEMRSVRENLEKHYDIIFLEDF